MNQEEWLAERRRLGLPADPAKDFPPNFRADPGKTAQRFDPSPGAPAAPRARPAEHAAAADSVQGAADRERLEQMRARLAASAAAAAKEASRASGAASAGRSTYPPASGTQNAGTHAAGTQDRGAGQPGSGFGASPPRAGTPNTGVRASGGKRPKGGRGLITLGIVGLIALGGPIATAINQESNRTATYPFSNIEEDGDDYTYSDGDGTDEDNVDVDPYGYLSEDPDLYESVERLMNGFADGDASTVKALASTAGTDTSLLTPATARRAFVGGLSFEVTHATVDTFAAEVFVHLSDEENTSTLALELESDGDGTWRAKKVLFPTLDPDELPDETNSINGVKVNLPKLRSANKLVAVWPGQLSVGLSKDRFTKWADNPVVTSAARGLSSGPSAHPISVRADGTRTAAFVKAAQDAAVANYQRCLKLTDLTLEGCPFSVNANAITSFSGVSYRQVKAPARPEVSTEVGSERVSGGNGAVAISGRGLYDGQWAPLQGTLDVYYSGSATVKNGKVVYTE